ncbi:uncharacterized protein MONOS_3936 [Monocercomonoides exilis]|uniref:uncharacterized protein n=1 Tax=Monocercomonoides exilis TaxID=2049356 RepID=UPI003559DFE7|nr:hypothetical protein MONOS_3936 [Monocercomonoides exilis]
MHSLLTASFRSGNNLISVSVVPNLDAKWGFLLFARRIRMILRMMLSWRRGWATEYSKRERRDRKAEKERMLFSSQGTERVARAKAVCGMEEEMEREREERREEKGEREEDEEEKEEEEDEE